MKWPRVMTAPTIAVGSLVVLLSAVVLGVSISAVRILPAFGSRPLLGRTLDRSGIAPLSDRFVDQVLGPSAPAADPKANRVGSRKRHEFGGVDDTRAEVADHGFTNNDQANAYRVTRLPFTARTSTADADREAGEPECGTQVGGTVWYRYKATRSEVLLADTFGTSYQTSLAAYDQTSGGAGPLVACDFQPNGNSQIRIDTSAETTYLFQIGAAVRGGALTFNLKRLGGGITLASVSTGGLPSNSNSDNSSVSVDGRYVAFVSEATNLDAARIRKCIQQRTGGSPGEGLCSNVFFRDRQAGTTRLVSVALDGASGNGSSGAPQVSDDGRYVVFWSGASNLVAGDKNDLRDIFLRDMRTGRTELVSVNSKGEQALPSRLEAFPPPLGAEASSNGSGRRGSLQPSLSADGRYVVFDSTAPNLVDDDNDDDSRDTFIRDRQEGTTRMVSLGDGGRQSATDVFLDSISRDGRWVVFITDFPMTEDDGDLSQDVFVRDLKTGTTELVSLPQPGHETEGVRPAAAASWGVSQRSISDEGRFIVFGSDGALVNGDGNGALDVFVRDRLRQTTERVSVSSSGGEGVGGGTGIAAPVDSSGGQWAISGDGRMVAFASKLNLLEPSDKNELSDVFVHDRTSGETLLISGLISGSGSSSAAYRPRISGDGMSTAFDTYTHLTFNDTNNFSDVFVFSPLAAAEAFPIVGCTSGATGCFPYVVADASLPTPRCGTSSEYAVVGPAGAHEDVTPAVTPSLLIDILAHPLRPTDYSDYPEGSVVRFKYRIDVSGTSTKPFARTAGVRIGLRWDNTTDYDLYVYDANAHLLALSIHDNNSNHDSSEAVFIPHVRHCADLRIDVVNALGLPTTEMTLDTTIGGRN